MINIIEIKKIGLIFCVIFISILFNSCEKDTILSSDEGAVDFDTGLFSHVTIKNNALHFDSVKYVELIADSLQKISIESRIDWENRLGFKSMYSCIDDVHNKFESCASLDEYQDILSKNNDLLKIKGNDDFEQIIPLDYHTSIINRNGIYYVGKAVVKITPTSKIIVWSGDESKLDVSENILKASMPTDESIFRIISDDIIVSDYMIEQQLKSSKLGHEFHGDREHSKRKVNFWIRAWRESWANHNCDQYYRYKIEIKVENRKKSWGKWRTYNTSCSYNGIDFAIRRPIEKTHKTKQCGGGTVFYDPYYWGTFNLNNYSKSSKSDVARMSTTFTIGSIIHNNYLPLPRFDKVRGRATNRGIGNRYAGICYRTNCHNLN